MISYIFKLFNYLIVDQCASTVHIYKVQSNIECSIQCTLVKSRVPLSSQSQHCKCTEII